MKKLLTLIAVTVIGMTSAFAETTYNVEINLTTKQVTIFQDGKVIQGKRNKDEVLATIQLSKNGSETIDCKLESFGGVSVPGIEPCEVKKDGSVSFYGISYNEPKVKTAFKEAMAYLGKSDKPIKVQIFK